MKLPTEKFKAVWYVAVTMMVSYGIAHRFNAFYDGTAKAPDIVLLLIWLALLLFPIADEVSLFGVKLKREIEELKGAIQLVATTLQAEIRTSNELRNSVSQSLYFGAPPPSPEALLSDLEERLRSIVDERMKRSGGATPVIHPSKLGVPERNIFLFSVRYAIENEVRRIFANCFPDGRLSTSVVQMVKQLSEERIIQAEYARAIREVYAICSQGIHGAAVSDQQFHFVKSTMDELITYLNQVAHDERTSWGGFSNSMSP